MYDGWLYEGPDPSVGIFGEAWWHEDCENWNEAPDANNEAVESHLDFDIRRLTCPNCGATLDIVEYYDES